MDSKMTSAAVFFLLLPGLAAALPDTPPHAPPEIRSDAPPEIRADPKTDMSAPAELPKKAEKTGVKTEAAVPVESPLQKELRKVLEKHIAAAAKEKDGVYAARDVREGGSWDLLFTGTDLAGFREVNKEEYILRAKFTQKEDPKAGKKSIPVVIDYTLVLEDEGKWEIYDEAVYSVDGKVRFTYTRDHRRVYPEDEQEDETNAQAGIDEDIKADFEDEPIAMPDRTPDEAEDEPISNDEIRESETDYDEGEDPSGDREEE